MAPTRLDGRELIKRLSLLKIVLLALLLEAGCSLPKNENLSTTLLAEIGVNQNLQPYKDFTGLTNVQTLSGTKVQLSWNSSTDPNVVGYAIYDTTLMFSPKLIKTVAAPASGTTVTGLTPQTFYSFRVRAYNSSQQEDGNVVDKGAIPYGGVISAEVQSATSALFTFNDGSNADQILVYCKIGLAAFSESVVAVFKDTSKNQGLVTGLTPGQTYNCRVVLDVGGFEDNNTVTTTLIPLGKASKLVFRTQPSSGNAGVNLTSQPVVVIQDDGGNVVVAGPDSTAQITLTVSTNSPSAGSVTGTAAVTAVNGVATFTDISVKEVGVKVLTASKSDTSAQTAGSGPLTVESNNFTIAPGPVSATKSSITLNPAVPPAAVLVADGNASYGVVITLKDQYGNPISGIKPQFVSSISGDNLTQPNQVTDASGQVAGSISSTIADEISPYRSLSISSPSGLSSVTTLAPFVAGPAAKIGYLVQPVNSPSGPQGLASIQVAIQDANGNIVRSGAASTSSVTVNIASNTNGAVLSGTTTVTAVAGVATFGTLGIDKSATGYKLLASAGSFTPAYSNSFNVTSGTPMKIAVTSPSNTVVSGSCSQALTIQLKDNGNNPANAIQNTPVVVSGLGSASLYSSNSCSGTALSTTITFTAGTNSKVVYLKDLAGESLSLSVRDTSNLLTAGTFTMNVSPDKISLAAKMPSPPAPANTPMSFVSGACSPALVVTPMGDNNNPAPLFATTNVSLTGLTGSSAVVYTDPTCSTAVPANAVPLPATAGGSYPISIYMKDPKAEILYVNVTDPAGTMTSVSSNQTITILPSTIAFTGPNSVVAGRCSTAFTITLKDAQGNAVPAAANTTLNINGLASSTTGAFYANSSCTGSPMNSQLVIPQNSSSISVYFSDTTAEALNIYLSDPSALMSNSSTISIGISPAAFQITGPSPNNSNTTVCAGPFTVNTMDGATPANITAAIAPITGNLSHTGYGAGFSTAGVFYSDGACTNPITSLTFSTGQNAQSFYFMGQYPVTSLTLTVTDAASVLNPASTTWVVNAAKAWIGTAGSRLDSSGNQVWFRTGVKPVSAKMNAPSSVNYLHFDSTKTYLYVVDSNAHRILKYDYVNKRLVGWVGLFTNPYNAAMPISGSSQAYYPNVPSPATCISTTDGQVTPGWCLGGQSVNGAPTLGGMPNPQAITDDGTYIYVSVWNQSVISRFNAETGAFAGWIGNISSTPTGVGPGGPASCTSTASGPTPGWCIGGGNVTINSSGVTGWGYGNGMMTNPRGITNDGTYLYVAQYGAILRFRLSDGSFQGWIGKALDGTGSPTGATGCSTISANQTTPGWCFNGKFALVNPRTVNGSTSQAGGIDNPTSLYIANGMLYSVQDYGGGSVATYNLSTGAFVGLLPNLSYTWYSPRQMLLNATTGLLYFADYARVIATDTNGVVQGWMGKVSSNTSMSSALGNTADCSSLSVNANTPGWCLGGLWKQGMDEQAFTEAVGIEDDGQGHLLVGQFHNASIKMFDMSTGSYLGSLAYSDTSPASWSSDATSVSENWGFADGDFYNPQGGYSDGTYLYVADAANGRIKKISLATGQVIGSIGAVTTTPTGGVQSSCLTVNPMSTAPTWCLGGLPNPWSAWSDFTNNSTQNGILYIPQGITGDGTYIYVVDQGLHRIVKFNASTGAYIGWIGNIQNSPTGGALGCNGKAAGNFTPGWCTGGMSTSGTGDGMLSTPSAITYVPSTGNLYVIDNNNHRVSAYVASTGAFAGWIGRTNAAPSGGCTPASNGSYNVSATGWCTGGTSMAASGPGDKGGGFSFWQGGNWITGGIATDGSYLYISNTNNFRIDKYSLAGVWLGSTQARSDQYTNVWTGNAAADRTTVSGWNPNCGHPSGIWTDGVNLYGATAQNVCGYGGPGVAVWKLQLSTGSMLGWQGGIRPGVYPSGGAPGCTGASGSTPGWCQGGGPMLGYKLGQFNNVGHVTGDNNFIYVMDRDNHRLTRLPK